MSDPGLQFSRVRAAGEQQWHVRRAAWYCIKLADGVSAVDCHLNGGVLRFFDKRIGVYPQFDPQASADCSRMFPNGGDRSAARRSDPDAAALADAEPHRPLRSAL
jgi:hypothetical protein